MRITVEEKAAIIDSILKFDQDAEIFLFGSRVDDTGRGGDIDILIKSNAINKQDLVMLEDELFSKIDEQKLDFVLTETDVESAFVRMILARGAIKLWGKKN